jgi:hypothetical protein
VNRVALRRGAWALLEAVLASSAAANASTTQPMTVVPSNPLFVVRCWKQVFASFDGRDDDLQDDARKILKVLTRTAADVPADEGRELADELLEALTELDVRLSPENAGAALDTIAALCLAKGKPTVITAQPSPAPLIL